MKLKHCHLQSIGKFSIGQALKSLAFLRCAGVFPNYRSL
ncbi:hypothetical protein T1E_0288 [Pseudomonas putida DOT-T1E]|nr:hypothetical protein T1E_0288 [Pseudomonas putida DOT-T1E]